jgi:hypothetical protein
MTILRSGSTEKYSQNWASAFGEKGGTKKGTIAKATEKSKPGKKAKAAKATSQAVNSKRR